MPSPKMVERPAALEEFVASLRRLRERAGDPSFRRMASKSGAVSHATLHLTVTGHRLQPWETVREFVRACDGDEDEWHARWQRTRDALADGAGTCGSADSGDIGEPRTADDPEPAEPAAAVRAAPLPAPRDAVGVPVPAAGTPERPRPWWRSAPVTAGLVAVVVALVAVVVVLVANPGDQPPSEQSVAAASGSLHPGDATRFVGDVTIPDGTEVRPGSQFVKVWELQNTGSVEWRQRHLQRIDLPIGQDDCRTPERIPVTDTAPREHVQITVTVRAPATAPADCKVRWKMVDDSGRELLPGYRPIFFEVRVRS
ncbi:NBR1-Ig-like domain-containing protein [Prauserella cavernicola]|uniref:Nbr1 FW domain-containing protein n=1 Tax=Prauserella cavernicola TaxID=2800127 RepID=A0A934QWK3_9PSEU|nr:NBR1-Ig-like domain-containing protein [Prauserella cavernicola]MBK1787715.1 hypothetical protein [Prauserella cavernicola]